MLMSGEPFACTSGDGLAPKVDHKWVSKKNTRSKFFWRRRFIFVSRPKGCLSMVVGCQENELRRFLLNGGLLMCGEGGGLTLFLGKTPDGALMENAR